MQGSGAPTVDLVLSGVSIAAGAIEVFAVVIITVSVMMGSGWFVRRGISEAGYAQYKHTLGKGLLLGLEVLVAADVIRTVALQPSLTNVLSLGILVLIRTFLSWSLVVEIEGRWPWQPRIPPT